MRNENKKENFNLKQEFFKRNWIDCQVKWLKGWARNSKGWGSKTQLIMRYFIEITKSFEFLFLISENAQKLSQIDKKSSSIF